MTLYRISTQESVLNALSGIVDDSSRFHFGTLYFLSPTQTKPGVHERSKPQLTLEHNPDTLNSAYKLFDTFIDSIPDVIFLSDKKGRWVLVNEAAKRLFNLDAIDDWQGKSGKEVFANHPCLYRQFKNWFSEDETLWNTKKPVIFEENIVDENNNLFTYEIRKLAILYKNGTHYLLMTIGRDVTEYKRAEHNLRIADTAIESQEAIVITDANYHILRVNKAFTRLSGYCLIDVIGKKPSILKSGYHDSDFYQAIEIALQQTKFWQGEIWDKRKNGEIYPKWVTITGVTDLNGQISNYVCAFTDISENIEAEEAIHRLAYYDPLTDLPNRRLLNDRLEMALTQSSRSHCYGAVFFIDLDHFKTINDSKGHEIGDQLLIEVAQRLKYCVRQGDIVARIGGDEFIIMLENLSMDANKAQSQAEMVGEKVLEIFNQAFIFSGYELHSTPSIGICLFLGHNISSTEIFKRADAAMYQAKNADRNTLRFFDPEMQAVLESRVTTQSELHHALIEQQFRLYFQIQIDSNGEIFGAECLIRWEHPKRGLIFPDEFIPLAEESGLILQIGEWVLRAACRQLKKWNKNPLTKKLVLAVNVSALQFRHPKFVEQLTAILKKSGINPGRLKLELTESMVITDISDTIKKMELLKALGLSFSMDDFGTGYCSLIYLKKLPISQLKIDKSFVRDIVSNPCDAAIVKTILAMAETLGLNVIAEGVENEKQFTLLEQYGCPAYQGYLFGKALPINEFEKLINQINVSRNQSSIYAA